MVSKVWHLICGRPIKAQQKAWQRWIESSKRLPRTWKVVSHEAEGGGKPRRKRCFAISKQSTPSPILMSKQSGDTALTVTARSVNNGGADGPEADPAQSLDKAPINATTLAGPVPTLALM